MRGVFSRQAPPDWQLGISGDALIRLAYSVQAHRNAGHWLVLCAGVPDAPSRNQDDTPESFQQGPAEAPFPGPLVSLFQEPILLVSFVHQYL